MRKIAFRNVKLHRQTAKRIACIMKLSAFFLLLCLQVSATGSGQKITINAQNEKLGKVLKLIERQSFYRFVYSNQVVPVNTPVTIQVAEKDLTDVLSQLLNKFNLDFREEGGKMIVIFQEKEKVNIKQTPDRRIEGIVYNETGGPLQGASVLVKGTNIGTTTNANGVFVINVPDNQSVLVVSYVGYLSQEVTVQEGRQVSVRLQIDDSKKGEEIVVVGYGTQRKKDLTGSVARVTSEEIRQVPVMSAEQALQGRAAGVMVMQSNGAPGGAVQVQIRGVNSTNAGRNGPLYVVDGVPLFDVLNQNTASAGTNGSPQNNTGSPIATLNPNDIETIDILKDASATAIYGARAANGVVVITTKSGRSGKTRVNLDYYYGVQSMTKKLDMMNATEGMLTRRNALLNTISDGGFYGRPLLSEAFNPFSIATSPTFKNTNWQDVMFRNAPIQDANISVSGGTDKVRFLTSTNYFKQEGIFRNTDMRRISSRINLDATLSSKLKMGIRFTYANQEGNNVEDANPFQGTVLLALQTEGWNAPFNADGSYFGPLAPGQPNGNLTFWNSRNPAFEADKNIRPLERNRTNGNIFGEFEIIKGLRFRSSLGIDNNTLSNRRIQAATPRGPYLVIAGPDIPTNTIRAYSLTGNSFNWVWDQTLNYNKSFGNHTVDALLGFSSQQNKVRNLFLQGDGSTNLNLTLVGVNAGNNLAASEGYSETGIVSQFVRVNYGFKGKYLFTGTVRRDGSSNFGPDNRYGIFPAASVGWRISDEGFMRNISFIKDVKLRASYGVVGNQDIGSFAFLPRMSAANYVFGTSNVNGFAPGSMANEGLRWEENKKTDLALEFSLFNGRVSSSVEYYVNRAEGLLLPVQVPTFSGFSNIVTNLGTIENKGFEFTLNTININSKNFEWSTSLNLSTIKNTVIDLGLTASGGPQEFFGYPLFQHSPGSPVNVTRRGLPIGSFLGLVSNGVFRTQAETVGYPTVTGTPLMAGDVKYVDQDKNGVIDDNDRVILGSPFPDFFGGITNNVRYGNFTLNVFANFSVGNEIYNAGRVATEQFLNGWGTTKNLDAWTPANSSTNNPRLTAGAQSGYNRRPSDRFVEDGSFLRIRNVTLGYQLPTRLISKARMQSARIYISGSNLFTFTKYQGWDPEVNSSGNNVLSGGIDQIGYPVARTIQVGVNLGF